MMTLSYSLVVAELWYTKFGILIFHFISHLRSTSVLETDAVSNFKKYALQVYANDPIFSLPLSRITHLLPPSGKVTCLRELAI